MEAEEVQKENELGGCVEKDGSHLNSAFDGEQDLNCGISPSTCSENVDIISRRSSVDEKQTVKLNISGTIFEVRIFHMFIHIQYSTCEKEMICPCAILPILVPFWHKNWNRNTT